jgi:putative pyruvate formate lyase activating enzyme
VSDFAPTDYPSYLKRYFSGELADRAELATDCLADCALCGRRCHADRLLDEGPQSFCGAGRFAYVNGAFAHQGEEFCLRGQRGSGTIFFSHCNLRCVFCQNYEISWLGEGKPTSPEELARLMLQLQYRGAHNVNLVTPSHVVPQILEALLIACERGLHLPLVYNTAAYDRVETLRLLDGLVDIYLPDFKFWDPAVARQLARAEDYPEVARAAIREMHRQVGDLTFDAKGLACRGLLVRHMVLPGGQAGTRDVMRFLAREISPNTYVNVMPQYHPAGDACRVPGINRPITEAEYREALALTHAEGIVRLDHD